MRTLPLPYPPRRGLIPRLVALAAAVTIGSASPATASTAYGSINNFDVVNDTGVECHGFEIEIEDLHSRDITHTFDWNHYGTPSISEDTSDPLHPRVTVRYASPRNPDGTWAHYTAIPSGPIAPTDGHRFTNPSVNFGGEHFGVGFRGVPGPITYHWLVDDGFGTLVRGPAVQVSTPTFVYVPPAGGGAAQVQAAIQPPPAPPVKEFGPASWVKEIRTTTHNNNDVRLRDLVSDDPDDPDDRNWRNGEPDEVEVEWQLLQTEFKKADGGANGELKGAPEELPGGDEVVTRRYEFYKYTGPFDDESGEAMASKVGADDLHGEGIKTINGVEVDLSTVEVVGEFIGSQMAAFDPDASLELIEHLQDGVVGDPYPTRTVVIAGNEPFMAALSGDLPPGMEFDPVTGELSGVPAEAGAYQVSVEASAGAEPAVLRNYTLIILDPGVEPPARYLVDTSVLPPGAGTSAGDGAYEDGTVAAVTATAAPGFVFSHWSDNGRNVSQTATYEFTTELNRSLTAVFVADDRIPLGIARLASGQLQLSWPTNAAGMELQQTENLGGVWSAVTNAPTLLGDHLEVLIPPPQGPTLFLRLATP